MNNFSVEEIDIAETPDFEYRDAYFREAFDGEFASKNRINTSVADVSREKVLNMKFFSAHHTFESLLPSKACFKEHPEYYAEIEADEFPDLPEDTRPVIEFIGDSITEGISIDVGYSNYGDTRDMVYWDDSTAGYAWRTAKALGLRPVTMGYGSLDTTKSGAGGVIPVAESYGCYSDGYPMESKQAEYIVINHGKNDRGADKEVFKAKYFEFLCVVRKRNSLSKIISLTPFPDVLQVKLKRL